MNRKQVGRGFFMCTINTTANVNGARDKASFFAEMEKEYPVADGWEMIQGQYTGQSSEGWTFAVFLARYEDVAA